MPTAELSATERYERDGFAVLPRVLHADPIDAACFQLANFKTDNLAWLNANDLLVEGRFSRVVNLHLLLPALRSLFSAMPERAIAMAGFSAPASLHTSLYFERGSEQPLHRDTPYFWTNPPYAYVGLWPALEDVDESRAAPARSRVPCLFFEPSLARNWLQAFRATTTGTFSRTST